MLDLLLSNLTLELGVAQSNNGGRFGPLQRPHLGLWIVHNGEIEAEVDGREFHVAKGMAGFFYASEYHELRYVSKSIRYTWCSTSFSPGEEFVVPLESVARLRDAPNVLTPSATLQSLMSIGADMRTRQGIPAEQVRSAVATSAFNEYFYLANVAQEIAELPRGVIAARSYIRANFCDPSCQLPDIADAASLSPQHLTKLYKRYLDCTPVKYMWQLRAEKAIHQLKHTNKSVGEITRDCGFKDPFHFSQHIRKHFGLSPTAVRKRHWEPKESM